MKSEKALSKSKPFVSNKSAKALSYQDKNLSQSIITIVKVRSLNKTSESKENNSPDEAENLPIVHVTSDNELNVIFEQNEANNRIYPKDYGTYKFDKVIDCKKTQWQTYNSLEFDNILKTTFQGGNLSVICFGGRKSGKSYTIFGDKKGPGLQGNTIKDLFELTEKREYSNAQIRMSYFEIHISDIKDQLVDSDQPAETNNIEIREDPKLGVIINGVHKSLVSSLKEVKELIQKGNSNKTKARGIHSIVQISVIVPEKVVANTFNAGKMEKDLGKFYVGKICFAEVSSRIEQKSVTKLEVLKQNRSILALFFCIEALSKNSDTENESNDQDKVSVPFKDSKLTRLQKDSLTGKSKTFFIGNISQNKSDIDETLNTLNYLKKALAIKTFDIYIIPGIKITNVQKLQNYEECNSKDIQKIENDELKICLFKPNNLKSSKSSKKIDDVENLQTNVKEQKKEILCHFAIEKNLLDEVSHYKNIKLFCSEKLEVKVINLYLNEFKITTKNTIDKEIKVTYEEYNSLQQIQRHKLLKNIQDLSQGSSKKHLVNLYQHKMYEVENYEKTIHVDKKEENSKNLDKQLDFLKDQIKIRDILVKEQSAMINDELNVDGVVVNNILSQKNIRWKNPNDKSGPQKPPQSSKHASTARMLPNIKSSTNESRLKNTFEKLSKSSKFLNGRNISQDKSWSKSPRIKSQYREDFFDRQNLSNNYKPQKMNSHGFTKVVDHKITLPRKTQDDENISKNLNGIIDLKERKDLDYKDKQLIDKSRKKIDSSIKRQYQDRIANNTSFTDILHSSREVTPNTLQKGKLLREAKNFNSSTWQLQKHYNPEEISKIKRTIQKDNDMYKRLEKYRQSFLNKK